MNQRLMQLTKRMIDGFVPAREANEFFSLDALIEDVGSEGKGQFGFTHRSVAYCESQILRAARAQYSKDVKEIVDILTAEERLMGV